MADRHDGHLPDPAAQHESRDVNVKAISIFGIVLALGLIATLFAIWGLFAFYRSYFYANEKPPFQGVDVDARRLPPEPRLQAAPQLDLREMRAAEDAILDHYAWVDPDKGVVRIPIDRAIDIMAQRGFPSRPQAGPVSTSTPLTAEPAESGTGFVLQQVGGPLAPVIHIPPTQPEIIFGNGDFAAGRQPGGPPTPIQASPGVPTWGMAPTPAPAGLPAVQPPRPGRGAKK